MQNATLQSTVAAALEIRDPGRAFAAPLFGADQAALSIWRRA